jgi:hypothetical protein
MSLIVETGTASSTSEAYASVAYCDTYHASVGNSLWATLQTVEKEQALRRATNFLGQYYRLIWKGSRVLSTQALDWPRYNVQVPDLGVFNCIASDVVPDLVVRANAELALIAASGDLNPPTSQQVLSKQIGPIKVVYDSSSPQAKRYPAVYDILKPLLYAGSGANVSLRRV